MDTATIVALALAGIALLLMIIYLVLKWGFDRGIILSSPQGPAYRQNPDQQQYYRSPGEGSARAAPAKKEEKPRGDPRKESLPRCRKCGKAIGYSEDRCPKCGALQRSG